MEKMKIEIWSDIACPYCYIGKKKLEKALAQFGQKDKIELIWCSYELNPSLPKKPYGKPYAEYLCEQLDLSPEQVQVNNNKIIAEAKSVGLEYNLDKLVVTNTCEALRLVKLAKRHQLADEMEEVLFKAYFTDREIISDEDTLVRLGGSIGIPSGEIEKLVEGTDYFDEVVEDIQYAEGKLGLEFIPFYLFNNKHIIQGSVSVDEYLDVLKKSFKEWEEYGIPPASTDKDIISGQSCSIDGGCK